MAEINIFSLGGLQEDGKNLYIVEVDKKIFVLDAGLKYPTSELYGVDLIVNDISFLIENKERVAGIFLTHGHDDHIGGVYHILKEFVVPIYASKFTMAVLKDKLKENSKIVNIIFQKWHLLKGKKQLHMS